MPRTPPTNPLSVFLTPIGSIPYILGRPRLIGLSILPMILNILVFVLLGTLGYNLLAVPLSEQAQISEEWYGSVLSVVARIFLTIIAIGISGLISFILIIPLSSPFCDMISEEVEKEMFRGRPDLRVQGQPFLKGILHAIKDALERIIFVLPIVVVIFLIGLIPFIGPPVAAILGFVNTALFLSIDAYSYSFDRRDMRFRQKWKYLSERRGIWVPLGAGLALFAFIPCNLIWLPMISAASGTRIYCANRIREEAQSKELLEDQ